MPTASALRMLLIVPYGIEITDTLADAFDGFSFNRTLWN